MTFAPLATVRELASYRELFTGLVDREVRARYRGSVLGFLWSLLNPLLLLGIYALVFSVYLRVDTPHYVLMLFAGLLPWGWLSSSLVNASAAVVGNASLIKKVYFPLEILPLVNVTTNLVNYMLALPVLLAFVLASGVPLTPALLYFPLLVAVQFLLTTGLALTLATLNAFFRDVEQLLQPLLMVWFYLTPIVYAAGMVPPPYRWLLVLNPMAPLIQGYQAIFVTGHAPDPAGLASATAMAIALLVVGYALFRRFRFDFAEVV